MTDDAAPPPDPGADLELFVGPKARRWILRLAALEASGGWIAFNLSALVFGAGWLIYRRMPAAAGFMALAILSVASAWPESRWLVAALHFALSLVADRLYLESARRRIAAIDALDPAPAERTARIAQAGRTVRVGWPWIVAGTLVLGASLVPIDRIGDEEPLACGARESRQEIARLVRERLDVPSADHFRIRVELRSSSRGAECFGRLSVGDESGPVAWSLRGDPAAPLSPILEMRPLDGAPADWDALAAPDDGVAARDLAAPLRLAPLALALLPALLIGWIGLAGLGLARSAGRAATAFAAGVLAACTALVATLPLHLVLPRVPETGFAAVLAVFGAGLPEEGIKLVAALLVARAARALGGAPAGRAGWIALCAALGLGFAAAENLVYVFGFRGEHWAETALLRGCLTLPAHAAYGVAMGMMLAHGDRGARLAAAWLAPAALHAAYDFPLIALDALDPPFGLAAIGADELAFAFVAVLTATLLGALALVARARVVPAQAIDRGERAALALAGVALLAAGAALLAGVTAEQGGAHDPTSALFGIAPLALGLGALATARSAT